MIGNYLLINLKIGDKKNTLERGHVCISYVLSDVKEMQSRFNEEIKRGSAERFMYNG